VNSIKQISLSIFLYISSSCLGFCTIEVLSGGATNYTSHYQTSWTWKAGWIENGSVVYDPLSSNHFRFKWNSSLSLANARWGSVSAALDTLQTDYFYEWLTADFYDVQQFDSVW
jgi:hypothetical protein